MSISIVSRRGAGSLAIVASLVALLTYVGADSSPPQEPQMPQDPGAEAPRSIGDVPLAVPESATLVLQSTPQELFASVIAARARGDLAALARCSSTTIGRPALDRIDTARAERDFLDAEAMWQRIEASFRGNAMRIDATAAPARKEPGEQWDAISVATFPAVLAGRAGQPTLDAPELQLPIVRERGAWFVRVSQ